MTLSSTLAKRFDDQVAMEFQAALTYRQYAVEATTLGLTGTASWLKAQAAEEVEHAEKFLDHLIERGHHPRIGALASPTIPPEVTLRSLFAASLASEENVSASIRALSEAANEESDTTSRPLLDWFLEEQVEEEETITEILGRIDSAEGNSKALHDLDRRLAKRGQHS